MNANLRAARERCGMTQVQIAHTTGIAVRLYQYYETGQREPSVSKAIRIANALGATVETLFG